MTFPRNATTADAVFFRTYSRLIPPELVNAAVAFLDGQIAEFGAEEALVEPPPKQRETWQETTDRCVDGLIKLGMLTEREASLIREQQILLHAICSGRWLWVGGTEWSEEQLNFSGCYNCAGHAITSLERMAFMMDLLMQGCIPSKARVLTETGWRQIGQIGAEEIISVWTGFNWAQAWRMEMGESQMAKVSLKTGLTINCDIRHQFKTDSNSWVNFDQIKIGDKIALPKIPDFTGYSGTISWPYILGIYTGDGYLHKETLRIFGGISKRANLEKISEFLNKLGFTTKVVEKQGRLPHDNVKYELACYSKPLQDLLIEKFNLKLGSTAKTKTVPDCIWGMDLASKADFVQGIFDSDGCKTHYQEGSLHTPNLRLCQELQLLEYELGYETNLMQTKTAYKLKPTKGNSSNRRYPKGILVRDLKGVEVKTALNDNKSRAEFKALNSDKPVTQEVAERMYSKHGINADVYRWDTITAIEILEETDKTFTLHVEDSRHQYVADGVITKNCGVGTLLTPECIGLLPPVAHRIEVTVINTPGAKTAQEDTTICALGSNIEIVVGDSRKGWVDAYREVLEIACDPNIDSLDLKVVIDLSRIRAAGKDIAGFGGKSNPVGLPIMFEAMVGVLNGAFGRQMNSLEVCLLMDFAARSVVAGNIRRCIAYGQRVSTDKGLVAIEKLQVGDMVLSSSGIHRPILNIFQQGIQATIQVRTNKSLLVCTFNHKIAVLKHRTADSETGGRSTYEWVAAGDLKLGDLLIAPVDPKAGNGLRIADPSTDKLDVITVNCQAVTGFRPFGMANTIDIEVETNNNFYAEGVLVHNSANIRQGASNDIIFAAAKDNLWVQDPVTGKFSIDPVRDALRMGNHTRVFHKKPTLEECITAVSKQYYSGEGAIQWAGEAVARCNVDLLPTRADKVEFLSLYEQDLTLARQRLSGILIDQETPAQTAEFDHRMGRFIMNPCFAAGTMVVTRQGHFPIEELVGKTVEIWDGTEWVEVDNFRVTGKDQEIFGVRLASGELIIATWNHSFILEDHSIVTLGELKPGDMLLKHLQTSGKKCFDAEASDWNQVMEVKPDGIADLVYCCTVPGSHSFGLSCGILVRNCGEILGHNFSCNLGEVHLNMIDPYSVQEQTNAFQASALNVSVLLNHKFADPAQQYSRELDPIVGVSFTGLFDFFVAAFGIDWLRWFAAGRPQNFDVSPDGRDMMIRVSQLLSAEVSSHALGAEGDVYRQLEAAYLNSWRQTVEETVEYYCEKHGLRIPNRTTTCQPAGTKSLLTGASSGWAPPKAAQYIRRMTFAKDDPVALACIDFGYTAIPSQSDKDENGQLLDDPQDPRCTEWLIEMPVAVAWAGLPGVDEIDINQFSAIAQFDLYMNVQTEYVRHNTSATIELRETEIIPLATRIYESIQADEGYMSAALLGRIDDISVFPRLPFEPIDKATYDQMLAEVLERRTSDNFAALLAKYDRGDSAAAGPAGCDSDKCLFDAAKG